MVKCHKAFRVSLKKRVRGKVKIEHYLNNFLKYLDSKTSPKQRGNRPEKTIERIKMKADLKDLSICQTKDFSILSKPNQ
jgi:hypothetical protein